MNKLILFSLGMILNFTVLSQNMFNYQAILRDSDGRTIKNTEVIVEVDIMNQSNQVKYKESHLYTTDSYGVINIEIGNGLVITGSWKEINWKEELLIKTDITGPGISLGGTTIIASVPKANYASIANSLVEELRLQADWETRDSLNVSYIKNRPEFAHVAFTGNYDDLLNKPSSDGVPTLTLDGNILSIAGSNSVDLSLQENYFQNLIFNDGILEIQNGNSIDLTNFLRASISDSINPSNAGGGDTYFNTNDSTCKIFNGEEWVSINSDNQNLTNATIDGTVLTISIEDGSSVSINLASLLTQGNTSTEEPTDGKAGDTYYNLTIKKYYMHDGSEWVPIDTDDQSLSEVLDNGNSAGSRKIINLLDPTSDQDASTKLYVDGQVSTKVNKEAGKVLSSNDYTDVDKAKLIDAELQSNKDFAGGYVGLDNNRKIDEAFLPKMTIGNIYAANSETEQLALSAIRGDVVVRSDINKSFMHMGGTSGTIADWIEIKTPTGEVFSVNGKKGDVNINVADIPGLQSKLDDKAGINSIYTKSETNTLLDTKIDEPIDKKNKILTTDGAGNLIWSEKTTFTDSDDQTLKLDGKTISISEGNTIDLSTILTDDQTLLGVLANGNSAGNKKIVDLLDPTADQDASTKIYVDGQVSSKVNKESGKVLSSNDYTDADKAKLSNAELQSNKDNAGGYVGLDNNRKIDEAFLPKMTIGNIYAANSEAEQLALSAIRGDVVVRSDINKTFMHIGGTSGTIADWIEMKTPTGEVFSVNGKKGDVVINVTDIPGLKTELNNKAGLSNTYTKPETDGFLDKKIDKPIGINNKILATDGAGNLIWSEKNTFTNSDNQTLSLSGSTLSISNGNNVSLSFLSLDNQALTKVDNVISLVDGGSVVLNDDDAVNEIQNLGILGDALKITNNPSATTIDLSIYKDNTDDQILTLNGKELSIEDGNSISLSSISSDNQTLSKLDSVISLVDGGSITLNDDDSTNEIQDLSIAGDTLRITDNPTATMIDLSSLRDNTDDQTLSFSGTTLSIEAGNSVNLSSLRDNTDDQNLNLTGVILSIENGNNVDLSTVGSDNQLLSKTGSTISLEDGGLVTLIDDDASNEIQDLNIAGDTLKITNNASATKIDLSFLKDNTDDQTLSLLGTTLSIEDGNDVDLSTVGSDDQNLTEVLTEGNNGGGAQIKNVANPTDSSDVATKYYVDNKKTVAQPMTNAEMLAINPRTPGELIFCTDCSPAGSLMIYYNGSWISLGTANAAPYATSVNQSGTILKYGNVLTGSYVFNDVDGDPQATSLFQWYRADDALATNEIPISGANATTYTIHIDDVGKYLRFAATPVAGGGVGQGLEVKASAFIGPILANSAPTANSLSITLPSLVREGYNLNAVYTYTDDESNPESGTTLKWYRADDASGNNQNVISGQSTSTYTMTSSDIGKYITFGVIPASSAGTTPGVEVQASYAGPVGANAVPTASSVSITVSSILTEGYGLTGSYSYADDESNTESGTVVKWYRADDASGTNRIAISGATISTYTMTSSDIGKHITYGVTPASSAGNSPGTEVFSSYVGPVLANAVPVASSVTTSVDSILKEGYGLTGSYSYSDTESNPESGTLLKWYRADNSSGGSRVAISGATSSSYTMTASDVNKYITYGITPASSAGNSPGIEVFATYRGPVLANAVPVASSVAYTGTLAITKTLTGTYSYSDTESNPQSGTTLRWYRAVDNSGTDKAAISGAISSTYDLVTADVGKYIAYAVTPGSSAGNTPGQEVLSSYQGPIIDNLAPTITSISISASSGLKYGNSLGSNYSGYSDNENNPAGTHTYKWFTASNASGTGMAVIAGQTGNSYTMLVGDVGKYITVGITPVSTAGTSPGTEVLANYVGPVVDNEAPTITGLSINGSLFETATISGDYTYSDTESDLEGTHIYLWERADDAAGTVNKITIGTGANYSILEADATKYIRLTITPKATSGTITGSPVQTSWGGPISACGGSITYNGITYQTELLLSESTDPICWFASNLKGNYSGIASSYWNGKYYYKATDVLGGTITSQLDKAYRMQSICPEGWALPSYNDIDSIATIPMNELSLPGDGFYAQASNMYYPVENYILSSYKKYTYAPTSYTIISVNILQSASNWSKYENYSSNVFYQSDVSPYDIIANNYLSVRCVLDN